MTPFAHHAGEHLIVAAAMGSGLFSGSLLFLRAGIAPARTPPRVETYLESSLLSRRREADTEDAFLDAAERLLIARYSGISTRRLADEAGINHGLVHYYFGSMDELFAQVLERFTDS